MVLFQSMMPVFVFILILNAFRGNGFLIVPAPAESNSVEMLERYVSTRAAYSEQSFS